VAAYGPPAAAPSAYPPAAGDRPPLGYQPVPGAGPRYHFQLRRLTLIDQLTGASALVLFIALWLPWFGYSTGSFDYSVGGINAHSYLSFAVLTTIVLISYLSARAGWDRLPVRLPIAHAPLLLVVGVVQLLLVVIAFLSTPKGLGHNAGSWIGLIAALGASLPIAIPAIQASQRR